MSDLLIENVGTLVTGRLDDPVIDADSIYAQGGVIAEVGARATDADVVVDAKGATVAPGLIDSHVHPTFGDYTPRQRTLGWCESYLNGGITSMISNGEPHLPGRPSTVDGLKSLATLAKASADNARPGGVKLRAGTLILTDGMTEADVDEVHAAGVERLKFLTPVEDRALARDMVEWGRDRGMVTMMHCGGTSLPGVESTDADMFIDVGPDVAAHVNGGPTPVADADVERLVTETDLVLDLVLAGNQRVAVDVLEMVADRDELHRVQLGTDTPSGTGVTPLGVLLEASILAGMTDVSGAEVLCLATGTTAAHHDLDVGVVEAGRPADLVVLDAPVGGQAETAVGSLDRGEYPAVAAVVVDGEVVVETSRNTAPPKRAAAVHGGGRR